jgi:hypothetical protein
VSVLDKAISTRSVRDCLVATFPAETSVRKNGATCYAAVSDVFLCFNVQHSQFKDAERLRFAVNWAVIPVCIFNANPQGRFGKYPKEYDAALFARGRLLDYPSHVGDRWFTPVNSDELAEDIDRIGESALRYWQNFFPKMLSKAWHIEQYEVLGDHPLTVRFVEILRM